MISVIDAAGNYVAGYEGPDIPKTLPQGCKIAPTPPPHIDATWSGSAWIMTVSAIAKKTAEQAKAVRNKRGHLIAETDWTQMQDSPLTAAKKSAWTTYRQALRGVPEQTGFPEKVNWPVAPK